MRSARAIPWRFSFDRANGKLYAGDVGQGNVEEIDVITRGGNYGWRIMEGDRCYKPKTGCKKTGLKLPVATYTHSNGRCSVTGGYVYRGSAVPALVGTYVYGDFCSGEIFGLKNGKAPVLLEHGPVDLLLRRGRRGGAARRRPGRRPLPGGQEIAGGQE